MDAAMGGSGSMFGVEDVKATLTDYYEQERYMAYFWGVDVMVTWLTAVHVESRTELLAP